MYIPVTIRNYSQLFARLLGRRDEGKGKARSMKVERIERDKTSKLKHQNAVKYLIEIR